MKKLLKYTFCTLFYLVGSFALAQDRPTLNLTHEKQLKLDKYFKKPRRANRHMKKFKKRISFENHDLPDNEIYEIRMGAFFELYDSIKDRVTSNKDVTGVVIKPGLNVDGKIELFYQPAYLDVSAGESASGLPGVLSIPQNCTFYRYNDSLSNFETITESIKNNSVDRYREKYTLQKAISAFGTREFRWINRHRRDDMRSIFFPFQELFYLYHLNNQCIDPSKNPPVLSQFCDYENYIYVLNSLDRQIKSWAVIPRAKHTIMFSRGSDPKEYFRKKLRQDRLVKESGGGGLDSTQEVINPKDFANLGHLCPPDCSN